jgi:hypothetical protein
MPKPMRLLFAAMIVALSCAAQAGAFARHTPLSFYQTLADAKFARWLLTAPSYLPTQKREKMPSSTSSVTVSPVTSP